MLTSANKLRTCLSVSAAIYSARNEGKSHCFDLIRERFGDDCNYVAIGECCQPVMSDLFALMHALHLSLPCGLSYITTVKSAGCCCGSACSCVQC